MKPCRGKWTTQSAQSNNNPMETPVKTLHEFHFNRLRKLHCALDTATRGVRGGHKNSNSIENIQFKFGFAVFMHTHIDLDLWTDFYCNAQFVVCFYYCCRSNSFAFHRMPPIPFPFLILISFPISIWLRAIIVNRFHTSIASLYYKQILCYQTSEKKPLG